MVVWLVGLSCAGKSSIANVLADPWKIRNPRVVLEPAGDSARKRLPHTIEPAFVRQEALA